MGRGASGLVGTLAGAGCLSSGRCHLEALRTRVVSVHCCKNRAQWHRQWVPTKGGILGKGAGAPLSASPAPSHCRHQRVQLPSRSWWSPPFSPGQAAAHLLGVGRGLSLSRLWGWEALRLGVPASCGPARQGGSARRSMSLVTACLAASVLGGRRVSCSYSWSHLLLTSALHAQRWRSCLPSLGLVFQVAKPIQCLG